MKNYILLVDDHSGSMSHLAAAAAKDFNANITAIKDSATQEMLDTVVSVVEVGGTAKLTVTVSNPHVLKPVTHWPAGGGTPLWGGTAMGIKMLQTMPDIHHPDVSVLVMLTTDGEATDSEYYSTLKALIQDVSRTGRWSFVARVPASIRTMTTSQLVALGFPEGNIQKWDTTVAGMVASTQVNTQAMSSYFTQRSAGVKSTGAFYANAAAVNLAVLEDISKKVSLYVVDPADNGIEIRPFILRHRMDYLKGAAFYQLSKTEAKVSHTKQVLVREQTTGKIFAGKDARSMIGLPSDRNARLHPGDHKNYDIFIQSESVNRKLVGGSGVIYWKEIGVPFTDADLAYLQPKVVAPAPAVVQLVQVPVSHRPTPSPIPVTPMRAYFETRDDARIYCGANGIVQSEIRKESSVLKSKRWSVPAVRQKMTA
jgi:hypothetical protein